MHLPTPEPAETLRARVLTDPDVLRTLREDAASGRTDRRLVYEFESGGLLGLVTKPAAGAVEGEANAFLATVRVRGR